MAIEPAEPSEKELRERAEHFLNRNFEGIQLRAYHPGVPYDRRVFACSEGVYVADESCVVTAVRSRFSDIRESWPEMYWLPPAEVRFLAAMALALPEGRGTLAFIPDGSSLRIDLPRGLRIETAEAVDYVREIGIEVSKPILIGQVHVLRDVENIPADRYALLDAIDVSHSLLIRGLYCLLKSQHLMSTAMFGEEAFINVQIAREASLELIRDKLKAAGEKDPSYSDAHNYVRQTFLLGGHLADFLEDQHDRWVATRHPRSRFGVYWCPPLMADDYFETYEALISVYRHILLDEPGRVTAYLGEPLENDIDDR